MTLPASFRRLLAIPSSSETAVQKGHLIQSIIIGLSAIAILSALTHFLLTAFSGNITTETWASTLIALILIPVTAAIGLFLVHRGNLVWAAHFFFVVTNTIFFSQLVIRENTTTLPYLMLISVIGIATVGSVSASVVYTALILASMAAYYLFAGNSNFTIIDLMAYTLTTVSISFAAWVSANAMEKSVDASARLSAEQQEQARQLQRRAQQLQRGAAVSQTASTYLNLEDLLRDTVYMVRDQFGFYFVAIYLLDESESILLLREATGAIGEEMKTRRYQVDMASKSIVGWVAAHQEARIARDVFEDPVFFNEPLLRETRSELALPLQAHGRILGVLDVQSRQSEAFLEDDMAILQIMTNQVAISIDNARLFAATEQHLNETQTLLNLSSNLASTMDVGEIQRRAARTFANQLKASVCLITQWDKTNNQLIGQVTYVRQENGRLTEKFDLTPITLDLANHPATAQLLTTGQPVLRNLQDPNVDEANRTFLTNARHIANLEVPLRHGTQTLGAIHLFRDYPERPFNDADAQLIQVMANETAVAIHNATLTSDAQGRVAQLSALNRLSHTLSIAPTMHGIFNGVRREVFSLFEATAMSIILVTEDKQHLDWIYAYEYGQEVDLSNIAPLDINAGFSGQVVRSRQHLLINRQFAQLAEQYQSLTVGAMSSTWLGFPLIVANELIGVLAIENENDPDAFGERDVQLLETIAGSVAIALNTHLQFAAVQKALETQSAQRTQLQTAAEVAAVTTSILELDQLLERAVNLIQERFNLYYTGLFLIDDDGRQAVLKAATGEAGRVQLRKGHQLAVGGQSLIGGATGDGQARITQDVSADTEWQPNPHLPATRSELALPLRVRGQIIGALTVQSDKANAFATEMISILQTMSDQLAIAIDNARLLAQAEDRTAQQEEINRISTQLHNTADIDAIIHIGLKAISDRVGGQPVSLSLGAQKEETRPLPDPLPGNGRSHPTPSEQP